MKCNNSPILWRIFFLKVAKNKDYVNDFCIRPLNRFDQHCREWFLYILVKNNTDGGDVEDIQMLDDELNNYAIYFQLPEVFHFDVGDNVKLFNLVIILCFHMVLTVLKIC